MTVEETNLETENTHITNDDVVVVDDDDDDDDDPAKGKGDDDDDDDDDDDNPAKGKIEGFMDTSKAVHLLMSSKTSYDKIPGGKKENVYFVINNESNQIKRKGTGKSSFSDDCGVWESKAGTSPITYYRLLENGELKRIFYTKKQYCYLSRVKVNGTTERKYIPFDPQPEPSEVVHLHRYYAKSKENKSYEKRVTWLGKGGLESNLAVVEYKNQFPGLAPHGNSKNPNSEYLRTPNFVMEEAGELLKQGKPKLVYETLKKKYDEVERPTGLQQLRDKRKNEKKKAKPVQYSNSNVADNMQVLENLVSHNHKFVRSVFRTNGKSPGIILYTDEQIDDLKSLCCTGKTVLGVDKTFNLCDMHVSVTCYKQLSVVRETTKESPIFIGPVFIHDNSDFETYCHFFHHLKVKLVDVDMNKLVVGSDDERAMVKAITTAFPEATHTLCTRHLLQNASQKLQDDAVDKREKNKMLDMIFVTEGIINADDTICFEEKCTAFEEYCSGVTGKFETYFQQVGPTITANRLIMC